MTVTLEQARIMIAETFKKGHELGLKPLSAVVLDAGGHVQAFEREDGALYEAKARGRNQTVIAGI